jgi:hypothetical protein
MAEHPAPTPRVVAAMVPKWLDAEAARPTKPTLTFNGKEANALLLLLLVLRETAPEVVRPATDRILDLIMSRGIEETRVSATALVAPIRVRGPAVVNPEVALSCDQARPGRGHARRQPQRAREVPEPTAPSRE